MVEISLSGSGEGPGWATAPGYSTESFSADLPISIIGEWRLLAGSRKGWCLQSERGCSR